MSSRPPPPPPIRGAASRIIVRGRDAAGERLLGEERDEADLLPLDAAEDDGGGAAELGLDPVGDLEQLLGVGRGRPPEDEGEGAIAPGAELLGRGGEPVGLLAQRLGLRPLLAGAGLAQPLGGAAGAAEGVLRVAEQLAGLTQLGLALAEKVNRRRAR